MPYKLKVNPDTLQLDLVYVQDLSIYLKTDASNGPVTGDLTFTQTITVEKDVTVRGDIYLKAGQKMYYDFEE